MENEGNDYEYPPAKKQKRDENTTQKNPDDTDFTEDVTESNLCDKIDSYKEFVTPNEVEKLREFKVLDETKSNDEDSHDEDSDSSEGRPIDDEEIEKMLEENLPESLKGAPKPKQRTYVTISKTVLEEKGGNHFEVLPLDWMVIQHYSGMPLYMHRTTRVCTLSKPYFLGKGNARRHDIPLSAVPCLAYKRALEEEEKQKEIDRRIEEQIRNQQESLKSSKNINENANNKAVNIVRSNDANMLSKSAVYDRLLMGNTKAKRTHWRDYKGKCPFRQGKKKMGKKSNYVHNRDVKECDSKSDKIQNTDTVEKKDILDNEDSRDVLNVHGDVKVEEDTLNNEGEMAMEQTDNESCDEAQNDSKDEIKACSHVTDENTIKELKEDQCTSHRDDMNNCDAIKTETCNNNENIQNDSNSEGVVKMDSANSENNENTDKDTGNISQQNQESGKDNFEDISLSRRPITLPGGILMAPPRVETVGNTLMTRHLTAEQLNEYCKKLFKFKTLKIMHFKRWADRRKYNKVKRTLQFPALSQGTKLITIPMQRNSQDNGGKGSKRDWVMSVNGCSYLSVFHEYVGRAFKTQPVYEFKQLENASMPYQATVYIGGMQYGVGRGSSKRQAKAAAARASVHILIPEMRDELDAHDPKAGPASANATSTAATAADEDTDFSFFDYVSIEDPRIADFCVATCEPSPHAILKTCLLRNFGTGDRHIQVEMKILEYQEVELTMRVGKHTATVVCKNKKTAKQRASQVILQALHPHISSWGSLLRLYGSKSVKSCKEKKQEEQQITLLQDKARHNEPNYAVLEKLRSEMLKLKERDAAFVPIGTFTLMDGLPTHSSSDLNNVDLL